MKIALIPVRGGSKRIPNKNIRMFSGKPLLAYPIAAAKATGIFDRIIVSTDSREIADVATAEGAEVPFLRPAELANDHAPTIPVIKHALNWLSEHGAKAEYCCCIYANPFVTAANLAAAFAILREKQATSVVPMTTYPASIYVGMRINAKGGVEFIFPDMALKRSQDMEEAYHDVGQFYWWSCKDLMGTEEIGKLRELNRYPLLIPRSQAQDLNTPEDWDMAERLYGGLGENDHE